LRAELKTQLTDLEKQKEDNDKLTLEFEDFKVETEDQIAELKAQLNNKKKEPSPEKVVEKVVEVVKEEVPKEEAECQTDIGMEYFDRPPPSSRASRASESSNKQRVGGGGSIVKPPKPVSKQPSGKLENAPMNVSGSN
jgi:peptidoglycan hydrolase CwlO-like protein